VKSDTPNDWRKAVAAAAAPARRIVACGIGNDLRGDDAAGLLCLRMIRKILKERPRGGAGSGRKIFLLEGGEAPENQTGRMRKFRPDLVLLIDAARGGHRPGDIFLVEKEQMSDEDVSTHRVSLLRLVRYLEESLGAPVVFLGIEPVTTEIGEHVSGPVRMATSLLAEHLGLSL